MSHFLHGLLTFFLQAARLLCFPPLVLSSTWPVGDSLVAIITLTDKIFERPADSTGHRLIWWGGGRRQFAKNPMLHRIILRKSTTFTYVHLRGNKSQVSLRRSLSDKIGQTLTLHRYVTNEHCGTVVNV